ncbi:MAG TPA: hypothetical protein DCO79_12375 [Spirochaeta sp.]|nr:hypothetical protein [Spirochaeta sp.]
MRRILPFLIIIFTAFSTQFAGAFNWPVIEPVITSTFGGDKWDSYGSGIEIYGDGLEVRPSEDGELVFFENMERPGTLPSGIGNFVVIEHDRKLRTLYASIDPVANVEELNSFTTAEIIGVSGGSGKSSKPHLHFAVIDSEFEQYVNPLLLLNSIADNKSPVIRAIGLGSESGFMTIEKKTVVKAGKAEIIAEIFDPCMTEDFYYTMAPYKIQLFHNGEEIFYLNFESLRYESGHAVIQSNKDLKYTDFYKDGGFVSLGEITLVPGDSRFEILVSDYSKNETGRTFQLTVIE